MGYKLKPKQSYFSKNCRVCNYCKHGHMDFHEALLKTKHFDINTKDTVQKVWLRFQPTINNELVPYTTVMQHVRRHLIPAYEHFREIAIITQAHGNKKVVTQEELQKVLAGEPEIIGQKSRAEMALDDYIAKFHDLVAQGQIQITAQSGLQAIKIRADIDKSNKDRKLDAMKAFSGMRNNLNHDTPGVSNS